MRASAIIALGAAALATASPIEARQSIDDNYFQVSNFVYGCTTTCDWSFNVYVTGDDGANHPGFSTPVKCSGSTAKQDYKACGKVNNKQSVSAYIDEDNKLQLQYEVNKPAKGERYNYFGHKKVNAATSGKPQKKNFKVVESSATGVA